MKLDRLAAAIALTTASLAPLSADAAGRIEGRVGDAGDAINLEGAVVTLTELDRQVATGRDGGFAFAGVPAGTYTLRIEYLGADPVTTEVTVTDGRIARTEVELGAARGEIENLIVYGQAAVAASALNRQRASDSITSIVSANAIGALPDQNAAEALARVPGTFLQRDQGEGRYVGIRGIDPDLNATSVNGLRIPAPEDDKRAIQLDVIPAELLSSLEVTKSVTPDMDGDAVGGSINIESVSAFDRRGRTFSLSAESTYTELTEDTNPRVSGNFTDVFDFAGIPDSLGVAFAASWYDREFGSDNVENGDGWPTDRERLDGSEFRAAEEIEQREYLITRERYGAALNLDFRPNESSEYYLRSLYSVASDQEFRHANVLVLEDDEADNGGARNDSTVAAATWDNAILEKELKDRYEEASVLSLAAGGNHFVDAWTVEYQIGFSEAEQDTPDDQELIFVGEGVTLGYRGLGEEIGVFGGNGVDDPATYELDEGTQSGSLTEDREWSYRFDVTRDMSDRGWPGSLQFGAKARLREKTADAKEIIYDGFGGDFTIADGFATTIDYDLAAPFIGPAISPDAADDFFSDRSAFEIDDEETLINGAADDYSVDENVYAAYGMSRMEFGDVRVVGGLRWERTETSSRGNTIIVDEATGSGLSIVDFDSETSYDELMPSITMRWALNDAMLVRAAASRTIARPEIGDIAPLAEVELEDSDGAVELAAEIGNPDLEPYKVVNLDAAFEWYFGDIGLFSVGVFYKDIEDFIVRADVADTVDLTRFVGTTALDDAEVIQPINGEEATVLGAEIAFTRKFSKLPAPFDGFLVNANATFSDSDAEIALRDSDIPLPGQSDTVWNLVLGYEKGPLSMRVSSTFTGERLDELVEPDDAAFDRYQSDHFQIDFAATWEVTDAWQLQFEAVNINDEPFYANFGRNDRFNSQFEEYGRSFTLGVRYQNQ
jgi:TonB-dependent receptor